MKVNILSVSAARLETSEIRTAKFKELPSIQEGWRFNFAKNLSKLPNSEAFILVAESSPTTIEGCMIFQLKDQVIPYMAYLEIAPHNRQQPKRYDYVAGCLIAYAFRKAIIEGRGHYKSYLLFDVDEEKKEDEQKLIQIYRSKYNAIVIDGTTLAIIDHNGDKLIDKYLS